MLDETEKRLGSGADPVRGERSGDLVCGIICLSTPAFDEMARFLSAMGFVVAEGRNQLLPIFSKGGRAARVTRGEFDFNLEEDTSKPSSAGFNFLLFLSDEEIERAKSSGFEFTFQESLHGDHYTFKSPDGGTFVIS